jgi:feruloyl-CoA synthase
MKEVGAMVILTMAGKAAPRPVLLAHLQTMLNDLAKTATGSASRVARLIVLDEPPSIDKGEVTDKGSINQRSVLTHRATLVVALHDDSAEHILKPT